MAHALGGLLAMLFWTWFRRRYGVFAAMIAFAITFCMTILVAATMARAEIACEPGKIPNPMWRFDQFEASFHTEQEKAEIDKMRRRFPEEARRIARIEKDPCIDKDAPEWKLRGFKSKSKFDSYMITKNCGRLLGLTPHDVDQKVPWTPQRQQECEHAAKNGTLDLWEKKHAKWWE